MGKDKDIKGIYERMKEGTVFKVALKPPFPKNMLIEITNACNSKCIFCANQKMTRRVGHINGDLLRRVLEEAYHLGTRAAGFHTVGEPFVSNRLEEYVARAKDIGFTYVYLTTNGVLATPERMRPIIDAGLDSVKFSINAASPETYRQIHGVDVFDKVIDNLKFAANYRKKSGKPLKIYVSYVMVKQNQNECERLRNMLKSFIDDIVFYPVDNHGGMMPENKRLFVPKDIKGKFEIVRKAPCSRVFNLFQITCEGYLTACCRDFQNYLAVADLNEVSLKEAWLCDVFVDLRRRHISDKLEGTLCYNCLYNKNAKIEPLIFEYAAIYR